MKKKFIIILIMVISISGLIIIGFLIKNYYHNNASNQDDIYASKILLLQLPTKTESMNYTKYNIIDLIEKNSLLYKRTIIINPDTNLPSTTINNIKVQYFVEKEIEAINKLIFSVVDHQQKYNFYDDSIKFSVPTEIKDNCEYYYIIYKYNGSLADIEKLGVIYNNTETKIIEYLFNE